MQFKSLRSLSQHWLKNEQIAKKIVELGNNRKESIVLEIGAGLGALTKHIIHKHNWQKFYIVEKDKRLLPFLKDIVGTEQDIYILDHDIFKIQLEDIASSKIMIYSNVPYSISTMLMLFMIKHIQFLEKVVLLLQKEFVSKIANSKNLSRLGILLQQHFIITSEFHVKNYEFYPVPKVDSTAVVFTPKLVVPIPDIQLHLLNRILKLVFQQKRKILKNSLSEFLPYKIERIVDLHKRPNDTCYQTFVKLSEYLLKVM